MISAVLNIVILIAAQAGGDSTRLAVLASDPTSASALVTEVRANPDRARSLVADRLRQTGRSATDNARAARLEEARRLAIAYATAWSDSSLMQQVSWFARSPPAVQAVKLRADSLRRRGADLYARRGAEAALPPWRAALRLAASIVDSAGMTAVLGNIGAALYTRGEFDSAGFYLERARTIAMALGDRRSEAYAVGLLGSVAKDRGDLAEASAHYGRALVLQRAVGDMRGAAAAENNLGLVALALGDRASAGPHFEAALSLNRRHGHLAAAATNLVNLAGLAVEEGDLSRAVDAYRDAEAMYREAGSFADLAYVLHGRAAVGLTRGDFPGAAEALTEAITILRETGPPGELVAAYRDLAAARSAMGNLQGARDALTGARRLADSSVTPPAERAALAVARADLAALFNVGIEAEDLYRIAEGLYRQAGDRAGVGEAQQGRGFLMLTRGDYHQARQTLDAALRSSEIAGARRSAAVTRILLADAYRGLRDTIAARSEIERSVTILRRAGDMVGMAAAMGVLADIEAASRPFVAESLYREGLRNLSSRTAPGVSWQLHHGLGVLLRSRGALIESAEELEAAIADVESAARGLRLEDRRAAYLTDKWEAFADLAITELARGRAEAVFDVSERLRARQLLETLTRGRLPAASAAAAGLVAREQDLRRHISTLSADAEDQGSSPGDARENDAAVGAGAPARGGLAQAQAEYVRLLAELREADPMYARLVTAETESWTRVAERLDQTDVLLEYLVADSGTLVVVVTRDTVRALALDVNRKELSALVDFARLVLRRPDREPARTLWRGPLSRLHSFLIAPVERAGLLAGRRRLLVVPHGDLHYLPFGALGPLLDGGGFLIERFEIVHLPSASVWVRLLERRRQPPPPGALVLAPHPLALPGSQEEALAIRDRLGADANVLLGPAATESSVHEAATRSGRLHLATYGVLNRHNPLFSYVALAPGGGHDGRLEVHEVAGLRLNAGLVVLSACETALGAGALSDVPAGDDWLGLVRTFLQAGADNVVATLWKVEDRATAQLMGSFYRGIAAGSGPSQALAVAQRHLISDPATMHPFFWASFVGVGIQ